MKSETVQKLTKLLLQRVKKETCGSLEEYCALKYIQKMLTEQTSLIQEKANKEWDKLENPETYGDYKLRPYSAPVKYTGYSAETIRLENLYKASKKSDEQLGIAQKKVPESSTKFTVILPGKEG